jgi:TonB family protein
MKRGIPLLVLILASGTTVLCSETARTEQEVRVVTGGALQDPQLTLPKLVNYTRPVYSDEARRRDIEGVVTVEAEFDADGGFRFLRVVKGLGYGLDESALEAIQKWRFTPAYRDGQRISIVAQFDITFCLIDDPVWLRQHPPALPKAKQRDRNYYLRNTFERWQVK